MVVRFLLWVNHIREIVSDKKIAFDKWVDKKNDKFRVRKWFSSELYESKGKEPQYRWWRKFANQISIELVPFCTNSLGIEMKVGRDFESAFHFHICIPYVVWFSIGIEADWSKTRWMKWLCAIPDDNKDSFYDESFTFFYLSLSSEAWFLNWTLLRRTKENSWTRSDHEDKMWFKVFNFITNGSLFLSDVLFGSPNYTNTDDTLSVGRKITVPEGFGYKADEHHVVLWESVEKWTRRWYYIPIVKRSINVRVSDSRGIPYPGKGTADYNCDEGSLHEMSTSIPLDFRGNVHDLGSQKIIETVLDYRKRYPL